MDVPARTSPAGFQLVRHTLDSPHLRGSLVGDPSERHLFVCLPPGYESTGRRYPTAYLLHGFGLRASVMAEGLDFEMSEAGPAPGVPMLPITDVMALLRAHRPDVDLVVVIPDGWSRYGCSQWVASSVNGDYESYVVEDVVGFVDSTYRTIEGPEGRGVLGLSSGGFGAYHLGSRHPDVFGAVAVLSGDCYFEYTHKPFVYRFYDDLFPEGRDAGNRPAGPLPGSGWSALTYGAASCYSPNPAAAPHPVDLPVDFDTGEIVDAVWRRWLAFDPVVNHRERADALRRLRGLLLDAGRRDEYGLHWGHRVLSAGLRRSGVPHELREHRGGHSNRAYERHIAAMGWMAAILRPAG